VHTVVTVPPVAVIKLEPIALVVESCIASHPLVSSAYIRVKDNPSVFITKLPAIPLIFCEPFGVTVKLPVSNVIK
jgi:hypothetical protein